IAGWAAAILLALGVGFAAVRAFRPAPAKQLADQLRPHEEQIDDLEFLRRLSAPELFGPDDWEPESFSWTAVMLNGQSTTDQGLFLNLTPERQERIRQFNRDLSEEPTDVQNRIWNTLDRYVNWLAGLQEERRLKIDEITNPDERFSLL